MRIFSKLKFIEDSGYDGLTVSTTEAGTLEFEELDGRVWLK